MDHELKQARTEQFRSLCRERGERCTVQRLVILEAVLDLDNHPSADQVHEAVTARLPGIARTTVYRTLEHLARMGIITKACHPGGVSRYDARIDHHHHLVCTVCNQFVDFDHREFDGLELPDTSAFGFEVFDYRVQLRGVCQDCRDARQKEESK